jgi:tetratricopeptide (TPR) repeat protein
MSRLLPIAGVFAALFLVGCSTVSAHLKRGDELMQADLYEEALGEYRKAAAADPENAEAKMRIEKVRRELSSGANEEGLSLLQMKDYAGAIESFKKAIEYDPSQTSYKKNLNQAVGQIMLMGNKAREKKDFAGAISLYQKLQKALPGDKQAEQGLEETKIEWAKKLFAAAGEDMDRKLFGNALVSLVRIHKLVGIYRDSAALEAEARGEIQSASRFGIAVLPGKTKRNLRERTAGLVQELRRVKVNNCPTVDLPATGKPELTLRVSIGGVTFDETRHATTAEQKYRSGTRMVDNPKFIEMKKKIAADREHIKDLGQKIKDDKKIIDQARQAFADAGPSDDEESLRGRLKKAEKDNIDHNADREKTQDEVVQLRSTLSHTPRKLPEPVFDKHSYEVYQVTRTANLEVRFVARGEGGVKLSDQVVTGSASTSDKTNRADYKFDVKADPLAFPVSDEELLSKAMTDVAKTIGKQIEGLCGRWQDEILSRARQATNAAPIEATEDYVLYLLVCPKQAPSEIKQFLKEQFQFEDIKALRGK